MMVAYIYICMLIDNKIEVESGDDERVHELIAEYKNSPAMFECLERQQ